MSDPRYELSGTQFGFTWGPMEVARLCDDSKFGAIVEIKGKRGSVEIRVTPGGYVKVDRIKPRTPKPQGGGTP